MSPSKKKEEITCLKQYKIQSRVKYFKIHNSKHLALKYASECFYLKKNIYIRHSLGLLISEKRCYYLFKMIRKYFIFLFTMIITWNEKILWGMKEKKESAY